MGRGKVVLKRIEDKISRQVSFSKRRSGLLKKSHELAVMCDIDVALLVFSAAGRLHEFSTGDRMTEILNRYECFKKMKGANSININEDPASEHRLVHYAVELIEMIQCDFEENSVKQQDLKSLNQLEQLVASFLQEVRNRETEVQMGDLKAQKDKEMQLRKERKFLMAQIKAARMNEAIDEAGDAAQPQLPVMGVQINW